MTLPGRKGPFSSPPRVPGFSEYAARFNRTYSGAERGKRQSVYEGKISGFEAFNARNESFHKGVNRFTDVADDELAKTYLRRISPDLFAPSDPATSVIGSSSTTRVSVSSSSFFDWSRFMAPVADQGSCGSCYAFAVTATVEGRRNVQSGSNSTATLSEEELIDCSDRYGNAACSGGWPGNGYAYIRDNGICSDTSYGYVGSKSVCQSKICSKAIAKKQLTTYSSVRVSKLDVLTALSSGPLSVAVAATVEWFTYGGGVYTGSCGTSPNHALSLVGYGFDSSSGKYFWKLKNSWGNSWGESGYMRLDASDGVNKCGIWNYAQFPLFASTR